MKLPICLVIGQLMMIAVVVVVVVKTLVFAYRIEPSWCKVREQQRYPRQSFDSRSRRHRIRRHRIRRHRIRRHRSRRRHRCRIELSTPPLNRHHRCWIDIVVLG